MELYFANNVGVTFFATLGTGLERVQSWTLGGIIQNWTLGCHKCLFIGYIAVWGAMALLVPGQITVGEYMKHFQRETGKLKL